MKRAALTIISFFCILCHQAESQTRTLKIDEYSIQYKDANEAVQKIFQISENIRRQHPETTTPYYDSEYYKHEIFYHDAIRTLLLEDPESAFLLQLSYYRKNDIDIITSPDGKVKIVSFLYDTSSKKYQSFTNIVLYNDGSSVHAVELNDRDYTVLDVYEYRSPEDKQYYLIHFFAYIMASSAPQENIVEAYSFNKEGELQREEVFLTDKEYSSNIYAFPHYIKYDNGVITSFEHCELSYYTLREMTYKYINGAWRVTDYNYPSCYDLHPSLLNFKHNIHDLSSETYRIIIDRMPDDTFRYSSWKNKRISEEPDLVINNGTFDENTQTFSFTNYNYRYELTGYMQWEYELKIYSKDRLIQTISLN